MNRFPFFKRLGTKLSLMVTISILSVSIAIGLFIINRQADFLEDELIKRGSEIIRGLTNSTAQYMIHDDRWEVYKQFRELVKTSNVVVYAMVTDLKGEIQVHSKPKSFPIGMHLDDGITMTSLDIKDILVLPLGTSYDLAYPIYYQNIPKWIVRIGITKKPMQEKILRNKIDLFIYTLIFSLMGIVGSIIFSRSLSKPLHQLSEAAEDISKGDLDQELTVNRKDEIGTLIRNFNEMARNIKTAKEELEKLSTTDEITKVFNHRYFYRELNFAFEKSKRYNFPIACIMFDVDHFKSINDTYGHQFGDFVLKGISVLTASVLRSTDVISRYGGDEFLILLPHNDRESAATFAEKIRKKIEGHTFANENHSVNTSISVGVSLYPDVRTFSPDDLIKNADLSLYKAKSSGRNRVYVWSEREALTGMADLNNLIKINSPEDLKSDFNHLASDLKEKSKRTIFSIIRSIDAKDDFTGKHSQNVANYAVKIAQKLGLPEPEISSIRYAAFLHDVGKIGVDLDILKKNGKLNDEEYLMIKKHPEIAVDILSEMKLWEKEIPIIQHHHERYDGSGYPYKLSGENIPLGARILMLADAYDVIVSERLYKDPKSIEEAITEIESCSGTQFDPEMVKIFIGMLKNKEI